VIVGARGDHFFRHPEMVGDPAFDAFVEGFRERTGSYPIYSVFHMAQALAALEAGYEKAIDANGGAWPDTEQVAAAMEGLTFQGFGREVTIREDHQAVEAQMMGTTVADSDLPFKVLGDVVIYDGAPLTAPVGVESLEWIRGLSADFPSTVDATTFD
jgi:branched-chain amino acid transport system substrate-binding protein